MPLCRPIVSLDSKDALDQPIQIVVTPKYMSERLVSLWRKYVQPLVDSNYVHAQRERDGLRVRADVGWKWQRILTLAKIWDAYAQMSNSGGSIALCMVVELEDFGDFPIGMLTVVPGFESNAFGQTRCRSFAWYLADAPKEVYSDLLRRHPVKGVAHALIDCSVQAGLDAGDDGALLLHADPRGGARLQGFYRESCGMTPLPMSEPRISRLRFAPSEEYFHFDAAQAKLYSARFDHRRQSQRLPRRHGEHHMNKSSLSPNALERALSKVLGQKFEAQDEDWSKHYKAAIEQILDAPELLTKLAEALETIDSPAEKDDFLPALPPNPTLRELPASGIVDAMSEGWPIGSIPESPVTVLEQRAAGSAPRLPRDLEASSPIWLRRLLNVNIGRILAVDLRLPAALATAGDGWELPAVSIGERDTIRVNITATEIMIEPARMTSTEPLCLSVAVIRDGMLHVLGQWQFEQTLEIYQWVNSFESGVLVVSTHSLA